MISLKSLRFLELEFWSKVSQVNKKAYSYFESLISTRGIRASGDSSKMGDLSIVSTPKTKDGESTVKCPMLTSSNYTVWAIRMKNVLKVHKVWTIVDKESEEEDKNDVAIGLMFQAIPETLVLRVGELKTAKKVWDAIKARHVGAERVKEAKLHTLMSEFDRLTMKDTEKIEDFAGKLAGIAANTSALGEEIEESKLVKKFLSSLPIKKYIHIVASLEQVLDLKTTSFEDIIGRLKVFEERVSVAEETQEDQGKLMFSNTESQSSREYQEEQRGNRGRGGRFQRGRGRGRGFGGRDASKIQCFRCDKMGHYASTCPDRLLKLQEVQEQEKDDTQSADELMIHEIVYLNEDKVVPSRFEVHDEQENMWYLDNGASNHMTGDRRYFTKINDSITGKVKFGDDSRIDIKGKGSIEFIDLNGDPRIMNDVYYIPELRSNIISLGQATESGCDIRLKGEYLTMHDREGKLLVNATRSRNRLYKVRMGIKDKTCLLTTEVSESVRWHERLGHINFETLKSMV